MIKHKPSICAEIFSSRFLADLTSDLIQKGFGEKVNEKWWLFPEEALYLVEKGKIKVRDKNKELDLEQLFKIFSNKDRKFVFRYAVYKDLRDKGYLLKAGAKYGADFRVYEKGIEYRKERKHSKFLLLVFEDKDVIDIKFILGLNRVAHSVNKELLIAVVDREMDVTYLKVSRFVP